MTTGLDAPALVLLHAFPFDSRIFDGLRAALADADGPRLITPDLRGTGTPSLDELADQVVALLDAEQLDRAVVGGVSMGGYVTLNLLRRYPQRLTGLMLIDTRGSADAPPALEARAAMADRADAGIPPVAAEVLGPLLSPATFARRPDLVARLTSIIEEQPVETFAWNQRAMAGRPDSFAELGLTELPVLVICGSDDTTSPPAAAHAMANAAAQSTMVEIPAAGHLAVAEDPGAVAAAILRWLAHPSDS